MPDISPSTSEIATTSASSVYWMKNNLNLNKISKSSEIGLESSKNPLTTSIITTDMSGIGMGAPTATSTTSSFANNSVSGSCSTISSSYSSSLSSSSNLIPSTNATGVSTTLTSQSIVGSHANGNNNSGVLNVATSFFEAAAYAEIQLLRNRTGTNNNITSSTAPELAATSSCTTSPLSSTQNLLQQHTERMHRLHGRSTTSSSRSHSRSPSSYSSSHSSSSSNTSSHSHASSPVRGSESTPCRSSGGLTSKSRSLQSAVTTPPQGMDCSNK